MALTGGSLLAFAAILYIVVPWHEPAYHGRTAAQWFAESRHFTIYRRRDFVFTDYLGRTTTNRVYFTGGPVKSGSIAEPAAALSALGTPAVNYLIRVLNSSDSWVYEEFAAAFFRLPSQVRRYLRSPEPHFWVRVDAAAALSRMRNVARPAVPALVNALRDGLFLPRQRPLFDASLTALANLRVAPAELDSVIGALAKAGRNSDILTIVSELDARGPETMRALIAMLRAPRSDFRQPAVELVGRIGPEASAAAPAVALCLHSSDPGIRWASAEALGEIGPGALVAAMELRRALSDESELVRSAAARALSKIVGQAANE